MTRSHSRLSAMMTALSIAALVGCGSDSKPANTTTPAGLANPASVFCVQQGGTIEIVDESGGQVGYCNLQDGTRVEEWQYYRAQTGTTTVP